MPHSQQHLARTLHSQRQRRIGRRFRALLRHTAIIFSEFWRILLAFTITVLVSALFFYLLWNQVTDRPYITYVSALYFVVTLIFFEPALDFPGEWFLELFFFLMPALGLIFLTLGVADFAQLLFQRNLNESDWEEAMASTFNNHIIIAGLGHLGIRVVREMIILDEDVVAIEMDPDNHRIAEVRSYDVPVITGDARTLETLHKAGIEEASALIIATNDDLVNLQIASRVREVDQEIRLVMRMFDDEFARTMADRFEISAVMSASLLAAPAFAGAAIATEILQSFKVADRVLVMGRVEVQPQSRLDGCQIEAVEEAIDLSVVLLETNGMVDVHPEPHHILQAGDEIAVVAELEKIQTLAHDWNRPDKRS